MFTVDESTRKISADSDDDYILGVAGDNNSNVRKFKFNKITENGWDKTTGTIQVNFTNANGELKNYEVPSSGIESDDDTITATWIIGADVCSDSGSVTFSICSKKPTGEKWGSEDCTKGIVKEHTCITD